jgi:hypothetical protein
MDILNVSLEDQAPAADRIAGAGGREMFSRADPYSVCKYSQGLQSGYKG